MSNAAIELTIVAHPDDSSRFMACWGDALGGYDCGDRLLNYIPEAWLDLMPFMAARILLLQGYDASRLLIVHLQGADYRMMRAPLGAIAATPLVNTAAPVEQATRCVFRREASR